MTDSRFTLAAAVLVAAYLALPVTSVGAQRVDVTRRDAGADSLALSGMKFRMVGPTRGGRSTAVTGVPGDMNTFLMGTTGTG